MIRIDSAQLEAIRIHGQQDYPFECCGALLGSSDNDSGKTVRRVLPISNARSGTEKHNRFTILPEEMLRCELQAQKENMEVLGFYHSHPDHPAEPSEYDREHAWPFYSYIIVSVQKGTAEALTSWELDNGREKFNQEIIMEGD